MLEHPAGPLYLIPSGGRLEKPLERERQDGEPDRAGDPQQNQLVPCRHDLSPSRMSRALSMRARIHAEPPMRSSFARCAMVILIDTRTVSLSVSKGLRPCPRPDPPRFSTFVFMFVIVYTQTKLSSGFSTQLDPSAQGSHHLAALLLIGVTVAFFFGSHHAAQSAIIWRRFSNMSPRRYAASTLLPTTCASAISAISLG